MKLFRAFASHIPNTITLLNLFMGCLSVVYAFHGNLLNASLCIYLAGLFDFFDGFAARALKAYSELGKSLDSLADMISFGLAPSVILYQILKLSILQVDHSYTFETATLLQSCITYSSFLVAVFSALRLAKFNIDERQTSHFIGVPTPANAFMIASFPFILENSSFGKAILLNFYVLIPLIVVLSLLLTSEIPMLSLKLKSIKWKDNQALYILVAISLVLFLILRTSGIPFIFCSYLLVSIANNQIKKTV